MEEQGKWHMQNYCLSPYNQIIDGLCKLHSSFDTDAPVNWAKKLFTMHQKCTRVWAPNAPICVSEVAAVASPLGQAEDNPENNLQDNHQEEALSSWVLKLHAVCQCALDLLCYF